MKLKLIALPLLAALAFALSAPAADHDHDKKEAGPNGGRLLTALDPHAEFFVTADRKVQITFLDEEVTVTISSAPAARARASVRRSNDWPSPRRRKGFGNAWRDAGQSRVPAPPERMTGISIAAFDRAS
jgi:hypothetical protein